MDIGLALKKSTPKKRRAPAPPNPFTGEVDGQEKSASNPFDEEEDGINNNDSSFIDMDIEEVRSNI